MPLAAAFVETMQSEKSAESGRKIEIQIQDPVLCTAEGAGNPQIQFAENSVFPLGEEAPETCEQIETLRDIFAENEADGEAAYRDGIFLAAGLFQSCNKGKEHFPIREADAGFHGQIGGFREASHQKSGEPPVAFGIVDAFVFAVAELETAVQHLLCICA